MNTRLHFRKKSLKLFALTLSLALAGIGAVPATADCSADCCCKAPSRIGWQDISSIYQVTRLMQEYQRTHDGSHQVHANFLLAQTGTKKKACEQKTDEKSCGMEPLANVSVWHCTLRSSPQAGQNIYSFSSANAEIIECDSLIFGSAADGGHIVRAGPQPLYLQNLALLI
jgi:hypothetical protein